MSEPLPPESAGELPEANVIEARHRQLPLVWIIPLVAVLIGLYIVVQAKLAEGPTIAIHFRTGEGIEPGKTKIRYKDVEIGEVRSIDISKDRNEVIVTAAMRKEAEDYLLADSRFWVVRPRISAGSVSGLGTLLSGPYIGLDVGRESARRHDFIGLEVPPIVTSDLPGREFVLHADEIGSLGVGSPIFYRRIEVGQVLAYALDPGGASVTLKIFVRAPYDTYVNGATRFWQASGIDMTLDSEGVKLQTESLAAILEGGIAFQSSPSVPAGAPLPADSAFTLYRDHDAALRPEDTEVRTFLMYFKDSLRGLSPGAPVDLRGIVIGEVKSLTVEYDRGRGTLRFPVEVNIYPQRIRERYRSGERSAAADEGDEAGYRALVDNLVTHGMRAELKTGNLLTGQMYIAMDFHTDVSKDAVRWQESPPTFPTVTGGLSEIQDTVGHIAKKIDKLPFEQISAELLKAMADLDTALKSTDHLVEQVDSSIAPQMNATLKEAEAALRNAKSTLAEDAPLRSELSATLLELSRASKAVNNLADYLERHPESLLRGKPEDKP
jgi:paraquat-inducible protein B